MIYLIYKVLDKIRLWGTISLLGFVVILCMIQVVLRYFTFIEFKPFAWGDEMIKLVSIWAIFLAASCGARKGAHMSVDFFVTKFFRDKSQKIVRIITLLVVLITLGAIVWYGTTYVISMKGNMMQNLPVPMSIFYAAIPIGCAYLFMEYFFLLINFDPEQEPTKETRH